MSRYFMMRISHNCSDPSKCFRHISGADYRKCMLCLPIQPIDETKEAIPVVPGDVKLITDTAGRVTKIMLQGEVVQLFAVKEGV